MGGEDPLDEARLRGVVEQRRLLSEAGGAIGASEGFEAQCELAWANLLEVLASAGMGAGDLVKVTTFLTHPDQAEANSEVRRRMLGDARRALSVVVAQTLDSRWLLEIEAVAGGLRASTAPRIRSWARAGIHAHPCQPRGTPA